MWSAILWAIIAVNSLRMISAEPHGTFGHFQASPARPLNYGAVYRRPSSEGRFYQPQQQQMPSCAQLRIMWRNSQANQAPLSAHSMYAGGVGYHQPYGSDVLAVSNPYYLDLLLKEQQHQQPNSFGHIVTEQQQPSRQQEAIGPARTSFDKSPSVPQQVDIGGSMSVGQQQQHQLPPFGGKDLLPERDLGSDYVFGQVIQVEPDGGQRSATSSSHRHRKPASLYRVPEGQFKAFVDPEPDSEKQQQQQADTMINQNSKSTEASGADRGPTDRPRTTQRPKAAKAEQSMLPSDRLSDQDFFGATWHDKPIKF